MTPGKVDPEQVKDWLAMLVVGDAFDPAKHPRVPKGSEHGGEFGKGRVIAQEFYTAQMELKDIRKKSMTQKLTKDEQDAIEQYVGDGAISMNEALRAQDLGTLNAENIKDIGRIDSAISKSVMPEDLVVFRGLGNTMTKKIAEQWQKDGKASFVDKAFVSTSALKGIAKGFSKNIMEVVVRRGVHALPALTEEAELLLPRNSRFRVTDMRKSAAGWHVIKAELAA